MSAHRSPEEVFKHHRGVLANGDIWGIVSDYSDDAVFISPDGVRRGRDGIRQAFVKLLADLPEAKWELKTVFADDILLLEWSAESAHTRVDDGIDTMASTRSSFTTASSGCRPCATRCSAGTERPDWKAKRR